MCPCTPSEFSLYSSTSCLKNWALPSLSPLTATSILPHPHPPSSSHPFPVSVPAGAQALCGHVQCLGRLLGAMVHATHMRRDALQVCWFLLTNFGDHAGDFAVSPMVPHCVHIVPADFVWELLVIPLFHIGAQKQGWLTVVGFGYHLPSCCSTEQSFLSLTPCLFIDVHFDLSHPSTPYLPPVQPRQHLHSYQSLPLSLTIALPHLYPSLCLPPVQTRQRSTHTPFCLCP